MAKRIISKVPKELPPLEGSSIKAQQIKKERKSANMPVDADAGFFSSILDHIKRHGAKEELLVDNLFSKMRDYWKSGKEDKKTLPSEKELEEHLINKLEELKELEKKWHMQKSALEGSMHSINEREKEIQAKIEELKMISDKLNMSRNAKPNEYFYLRNGIVLKSMHELLSILKVIDDETFNHHVNSSKNDFSEWVRNVFKDNELADKIKNAKAKEQIIEIFEVFYS